MAIVGGLFLCAPPLAMGSPRGQAAPMTRGELIAHRTGVVTPTSHPRGAGAGNDALAAPPLPSASTISIADGLLVLGTEPYQFVGVNAYQIATEWGTNAGCGGPVTDQQLDGLFSSLPPNSLVRFWAFQGGLATNVGTGQLDWEPIDRVFAAAARYDQRLIVVLTDQGGGCDGGHWQDPAWYEGGFQTQSDALANQGTTALSYWEYLQAIVNRYRTSPALGMWEPISEPEASTCPPIDEPTNCGGHQTCPNEAAAAHALRQFFDVVGGEIHALDPNHLVESGFLGGDQCGVAGADYSHVNSSPGIDVLSYHDYALPGAAIDTDKVNGLSVRLAQAAALGKPIIGGEVGVTGGSGPACPSTAQRSADFVDEIQTQMAGGSSGVLLWDWVPTLSTACNWDILSGDPIFSAFADLGVGS